LLFWKKLTAILRTFGFEANPYDFCVMNKMVNGKQCTIAWHVDDLKLSHVTLDVLEDIVSQINQEFGKEEPLVVHRGKVHYYLVMTIDYSVEGKVTFSMVDYVKATITESPEELTSGTPTTSPAASYLFDVNDAAPKLDEERKEIFHHLVAKLLYLGKRARPDIQLAVAFLTTRVISPDEDDWKKLGRCLLFLKGTMEDDFTLEGNNLQCIKWWVDASFAVHPDMRSHTGATMSLGGGHPISMSIKQKLNTQSSTEAELVGVNDAMSMILWVPLFLEGQSFEFKDNIIQSKCDAVGKKW
jgi:hypothetical protein